MPHQQLPFEIDGLDARMKVVGIGGNAVNRMIAEQLEGVDFVAVNTDAQALAKNGAHRTLECLRDVELRRGARGAEQGGGEERTRQFGLRQPAHGDKGPQLSGPTAGVPSRPLKEAVQPAGWRSSAATGRSWTRRLPRWSP